MSRLKPYETYCMRCDRLIGLPALSWVEDDGPFCGECFDRELEERKRVGNPARMSSHVPNMPAPSRLYRFWGEMP